MMMPQTMDPLTQLRLKATLEKRKRQQANAASYTYATLREYKYDPYLYIVERLGWTPWSGTAEKARPGAGHRGVPAGSASAA